MSGHSLDTDQLGKEFIGKSVLPGMVYPKQRGHVAERRGGALTCTVTIGIQEAGRRLQAVAGGEQIWDPQLWNEVIYKFFLH